MKNFLGGTMSKYKEYNQNQIMLLPPSLEEKIPQKHLGRVINNVIENMDIGFIDEQYSTIGRKAYNPKMLLKILVYGYSLGMRSSRRLQRLTQEDLVFMWLAGMQNPDFRTISDFRKEKIKDIKKLFIQVLSLCQSLGLVKCGSICIDGTKIEANSSKNKITYRKNLMRYKSKHEDTIDKIFEEADKIDAEEDALYGDHDGYTLDREYSNAEIKEALDKLNKQKKKIEKRTKEKNEKIEIINTKLKKMGNDRNSFGNTDKDATAMLMKEGYIGPGYNIQFATENQIIVGYGVFNNRTDYKLLKPMIKEVHNNLKLKPQNIIADKGYASLENYRALKRRGITGVIPPQSYERDKSAIKNGNYNYSVNSPHEKEKLKMIKFLETPEGKALNKIRKNCVEPTIGDIKYNMKFRKFLLRLKPKVSVEIGLISVAHNIKKILKIIDSEIFQPAI